MVGLITYNMYCTSITISSVIIKSSTTYVVVLIFSIFIIIIIIATSYLKCLTFQTIISYIAL